MPADLLRLDRHGFKPDVPGESEDTEMPSARFSALMRIWLVAAAAPACGQWHAESVNPRELISTTHPRVLRVTSRDSTRAVVESPAIVGDTLQGRVAGTAWALALPDVAGVEVRRLHGAHTAFLMGGLMAVTAGTIAVATDEGGPSTLRN